MPPLYLRGIAAFVTLFVPHLAHANAASDEDVLNQALAETSFESMRSSLRFANCQLHYSYWHEHEPPDGYDEFASSTVDVEQLSPDIEYSREEVAELRASSASQFTLNRERSFVNSPDGKKQTRHDVIRSRGLEIWGLKNETLEVVRKAFRALVESCREPAERTSLARIEPGDSAEGALIASISVPVDGPPITFYLRLTGPIADPEGNALTLPDATLIGTAAASSPRPSADIWDVNQSAPRVLFRLRALSFRPPGEIGGHVKTALIDGWIVGGDGLRGIKGRRSHNSASKAPLLEIGAGQTAIAIFSKPVALGFRPTGTSSYYVGSNSVLGAAHYLESPP